MSLTTYLNKFIKELKIISTLNFNIFHEEQQSNKRFIKQRIIIFLFLSVCFYLFFSIIISVIQAEKKAEQQLIKSHDISKNSNTEYLIDKKTYHATIPTDISNNKITASQILLLDSQINIIKTNLKTAQHAKYKIINDRIKILEKDKQDINSEIKKLKLELYH